MKEITKLNRSPFIKVHQVYRTYYEPDSVSPVHSRWPDGNVWMINMHNVSRIADLGMNRLIINGKDAGKVPVTNFFFSNHEPDSENGASMMAIIEFEAVQDLVGCWEYVYQPEGASDEE